MPEIQDKANQPTQDKTGRGSPDVGRGSPDPAHSATDAGHGSPDPAQSPAEALPATLEDAHAEIERLQGELQSAREQVLRAHAEFDNTRKRWQRERDEERQYAAMPLLADLLQVWDNVARAIEAAEKSPDPASLLAGFKMVAQQLTAVQQKHHCQEIPALGQPFDPHLHEALLKQPSDKYPANTVSQVVRAGFKLPDRVIRPAQVIVSTGPG